MDLGQATQGAGQVKSFNDALPTVKKTAGPNTAFESLAWEVFFKERNRGISIDKHFPWIASGEPKSYLMLAELNGCVVGGLAVCTAREGPQARAFEVGLIGLVCVAHAWRKKGVANLLVSRTLAQMTEDGFDMAILWTGNPSIYSSHGFVTSDPWSFGWVCNPKANAEQSSQRVAQLLDLEPAHSIAIPPYANAVHLLRGAKSQIQLVFDAHGWIVAGYSGEAPNAAATMQMMLPDTWRLNAVEGDPIVECLQQLDLLVDLKPANLQMWRSLNGSDPLVHSAKSIRIPVLERI